MTTPPLPAGRIVRIGAGAGFSGDRIDAAIELAVHGDLQYLVFECLAERTIARAVQMRRDDPSGGYDPFLEERLRAVLPICAARGVRIISNMGAANPVGAARRAAEVARSLGLAGVRIAAVVGDDVLDLLRDEGAGAGHDASLADVFDRMISANAYVGADGIVKALADGADVILTGRVADASLFLAPLIHEFGWSSDDWLRLGRGVAVGHLLECAGQVTGGYFADPGFKDVPGLARLGFPIAEVEPDGSAVITKVEGSGGQVCVAGVTEQLLYELHDPRRYLSPDVSADFSEVQLEQEGPDRVRVTGAKGRPRPERLKVSIGYGDGFLGEGQISYGGPGAVARGRLALDIVSARLKALGDDVVDLRLDLIGVNALSGAGIAPDHEPTEVRARVAARTRTREAAFAIGREVDALYTNGPAGGGGVHQSVQPILAIASSFIDRRRVRTDVRMEVS